MKDFIEKYKIQNHRNTISIIAISLVLALGINFGLGGSQYGKYVKSSIIDATQTEKDTGDFYLKLTDNGNSIALKAGKNLTDVKKLAVSLSYNPEGLKINSIFPAESTTTGQSITNTPGFQTTFFLFETAKNIQADETIATINVEKLSQKIEFINLFSVNIENSNNNITELSSSGIDF